MNDKAGIDLLMREFFSDADRVKNLVDGIQTEIVILDRAGRYLYMNSFAADGLSGRPEEFVGRVLWDVFPGETADRMQKEILQALSSGQTRFCELEVIMPGGSRIYKAVIHPLRIPREGGESSACFVVLNDVSEERRLNFHLLHSARLSAVGQLAAGVAHEFNNILAVIEGLAQIHLLSLETRGKDADLDGIAEGLKRIVLQSERAARITRQVQNFATPSQGERRPCPVESLIAGVIRLNEPQAALERLEIRTEVESGLTVRGDPGQLEQVFINLMVNARHAILPKGEGRIMIRAFRSGDKAEILFTDNGIGMDEKTASRVFEPFFTTKGSSARDKFGIRGTGLGLAVAYSIVAGHSGSISVSSTPGFGSEFRVLLPQCGDSLAAEAPPACTDKHFSVLQRVLIVEAEKDLAEAVAVTLREKGAREVSVCHKGREGIEAVRRKLYDIVLLDVSLPDASVEEIIREMRALDTQIRIVCMTGRVDEDVAWWKEWGADGLLHKPFSMEDMLGQMADPG